jgi:hypothetical protein
VKVRERFLGSEDRLAHEPGCRFDAAGKTGAAHNKERNPKNGHFRDICGSTATGIRGFDSARAACYVHP